MGRISEDCTPTVCSFLAVHVEMEYRAFATDYDGTLALNGRLKADMVTTLTRLRESGRKLILVTGRGKEDLELCCPHLAIFDSVVFENGALLGNPKTGDLRLLTQKAPEKLIQLLRVKRVDPLFIGRCILATREKHEATVAQCIQDLELNYSTILNKGSVMILPAKVNKGSGLITALKELEIFPSQTIGIGDAENDVDLLKVCGSSYAVADATPGLKAIAQYITQGGTHFGPLEVILNLL